jgi:hypothetical protein
MRVSALEGPSSRGDPGTHPGVYLKARTLPYQPVERITRRKSCLASFELRNVCDALTEGFRGNQIEDKSAGQEIRLSEKPTGNESMRGSRSSGSSHSRNADRAPIEEITG